MPDFFAARTFSADEKGVVDADDWLECASRSWGVDDATAFRTRLCVAELAANLLHHGLASEGVTFTIQVSRDGEAAEVHYFDDGRPFDPTRRTSRTPPFANAAMAVGGLGLHLVRLYAPRISYARDAGRNHVRFCFRSRSASE